jgi:hypothetical protein
MQKTGRMSIEQTISERGIGELLHFTTNQGALGILASKAIKPRGRLASDPLLEKIFHPNAEDRRRDSDWHDYVNLSVTAINSKFFSISANNWHREKGFWWAIFSVQPEVMAHDGIYFTTTNNMYSGVDRAQGVIGLESMFASRIKQWHTSTVTRSDNALKSQPTCNQAEVLYPGELPTNYVHKIYVFSDVYADELAGQIAAVGHPDVPVVVRPELFGDIK